MSDLSLDELLSKIDEAEKKQQRSVKNRDSNSVDRFISDLEIKTGLERIPTFVIYYHYRRKWYDTNKDKKVNKIVFFRAFNKKFTQIRTGKQRYYLLNPSSFDLSRESILQAEHYEERLREKAKEKKRKMGQSKKEQESKT